MLARVTSTCSNQLAKRSSYNTENKIKLSTLVRKCTLFECNCIILRGYLSHAEVCCLQGNGSTFTSKTLSNGPVVEPRTPKSSALLTELILL